MHPGRCGDHDPQEGPMEAMTDIRQESTARDLVRVPKHTGAMTGFGLAITGVCLTGFFCSWFDQGRIKQVNAPVASGIMVAISLVIAAFAWYLARVITAPEKFIFYRGMIAAGAISAAISVVTMVGTLVYRDQSGGQTLNGQEAMFIIAPLVGVCLLAELIVTRNLGGLKRKPR